MSVKELTKLNVTDLWKEYNRLGDFWEVQEEAVKEFRRRLIEGALETERNMHLGCKPYERGSGRKDYRNGYWSHGSPLRMGDLRYGCRG